MKSPYRNTDGLPETGEVTVAFRDDRFPVGQDETNDRIDHVFDQ